MNTQPDQEDVKFAKSLVNPEKSIRDKTLFTFKKHISSLTSVEHLEMLKIWKALYYCMWLSDKQPIQAELAERLCEIMDDFSSQQLSLLYLRMFFRIMMREWAHLDQYRVNKFYSLIRLMFRKALKLANEASWSSDLAGAVLSIIDEEALTKKPNGIRFHLADIYLSELHLVTNGEISSKDILIVLQPLHASLLRLGDHAAFIDRVGKEVFTKYATHFAAENASSSENEDEEGEPTTQTVFKNVNTKVLQKWLFDTASEENTPDHCRKKLYDLHKAFAARTGLSFVSETIDDMLAGEGGKGKAKATPAKKAKKVESVVPASNVPSMSTVVATPATDKKDKKTKRTISEMEEDIKPVDSAVEKSAKKKVMVAEVDVAPSSTKKIKKTKEESRDQEVVPTPTPKSANKSKAVSAEGKTPLVSENKVVKKTEESISSTGSGEATPAKATPPPVFIASAKFAGRKEGYMFQKVNFIFFMLQLFIPLSFPSLICRERMVSAITGMLFRPANLLVKRLEVIAVVQPRVHRREIQRLLHLERRREFSLILSCI